MNIYNVEELFYVIEKNIYSIEEIIYAIEIFQ